MILRQRFYPDDKQEYVINKDLEAGIVVLVDELTDTVFVQAGGRSWSKSCWLTLIILFLDIIGFRINSEFDKYP